MVTENQQLDTVSVADLPFEEKTRAAQSLIQEELESQNGEICATSSFQAEDVVLVHMLQPLMPQVPVIFLDTGYHFAETYAYRDRIAGEWNLNLVNLFPAETVAEQEARFGILYQSDPSRCCSLRKVEPLFRELEKYGVWFTGMRREQAKSRAQLQLVDQFKLPSGAVLRKINPLADWTAKDVWQYAAMHGIPLLSLYQKGYTSIGCEPCTSLPFDPTDPRSGRWGGRKQECGIHIQSA